MNNTPERLIMYVRQATWYSEYNRTVFFPEYSVSLYDGYGHGRGIFVKGNKHYYEKEIAVLYNTGRESSGFPLWEVVEDE